VSTSWTRAAVLPAEPSAFVEALQRAAAAGFTHVELTALIDRPPEHLEALGDSGLFVVCASLGRGMGVEDVEVRRRHLERHRRLVSDAGRLGATLVYLTPPVETGALVLACFAEGCELLAGFAASRMVRLAIMPLAGTCLPDATEALAWLEGREEIGLALVEPRAEEVRQAGRRLGYVRAGRDSLDEQALRDIGFGGVVAVLVNE
jgi:sugar phosphate isomerase/epimerase